MEYTIQKLAELAGVTTRTLRWYHRIGLLTPSRIGENGYRYYGRAEVDRLQQILFYRALGVELARIGAILDDPSFDRLDALRGHLAALEKEEGRIQELIHTVKRTILSEERNEFMSDEAKFEAFKRRTVAHNEEVYGARYGAEIREKYGDEEAERASRDILDLTPERYQSWKDTGEAIQRKLEEAVRSGADPAGEAGRALAELHRAWLSFGSSPYDPARQDWRSCMYRMNALRPIMTKAFPAAPASCGTQCCPTFRRQSNGVGRAPCGVRPTFPFGYVGSGSRNISARESRRGRQAVRTVRVPKRGVSSPLRTAPATKERISP